MAEFNVRADGVDVEQIMRQIRSRIRDKRGVDYTEDQIQELARVKLEKFLDPKGVRSDLLDQFRKSPVPPSPQTYEFDDKTLFETDKAIVRFFRTLLRPFLKLLFNPNTLNHVLHTQTGINRFMVDFTEHRAARDMLYYEIIHNLVVEVTRATIEVKNMKMRVESIASRLEFNERRARALEAVVQYRPDADTHRSPGEAGAGRPQERERHRDRDQAGEPAHRTPGEGGRRVVHSRQHQPQGGGDAVPNPPDPITGGESLRSRRKRRRRGRRSGPGFAEGVANHGEGGGANHGEGMSAISGDGTSAGHDGEEPLTASQGTPAGNPSEGTPGNAGEGAPAGNPSEGTSVKDPSES